MFYTQPEPHVHRLPRGEWSPGVCRLWGYEAPCGLPLVMPTKSRPSNRKPHQSVPHVLLHSGPHIHPPATHTRPSRRTLEDPHQRPRAITDTLPRFPPLALTSEHHFPALRPALTLSQSPSSLPPLHPPPGTPTTPSPPPPRALKWPPLNAADGAPTPLVTLLE